MSYNDTPVLRFLIVDNIEDNGRMRLIEPQYITELPILNDLPPVQPFNATTITTTITDTVTNTNIYAEYYHINHVSMVYFEYLHLIDRIKNQYDNNHMLYHDIQYAIGVLTSLYGIYYFVIKILQSVSHYKNE